MKKLSLTTWERLQLIQCLPKTSPHIPTIARLLALFGKLELTKEEQQKVNLIVTTNGQATWSNPELTFDIEFEDAQYAELKKLVGARTDWPVVKETMQLAEKFDLGE